jgi:hypothetical protein
LIVCFEKLEHFGKVCGSRAFHGVFRAIVPVDAQQLKYKMTADIPASITTPDKVGTSLGTLRFFDGFPDDATVKKVYDNLDFQRGVQAFLTAMPARSSYAMQAGFLTFGPDNQTVLIAESLLDSHSLVLTGNTEPVYNNVWLKTKDGPQVIEVPPNVQAKDFWSFTVNDPQTQSMLQTDQRFPSCGSQKQGVIINPDTSVDVWFGQVAPPGKEANWIQNIPGKGWLVTLRLYGPLEPWFDKTWKPGEIELTH